MSSKNIGRAVRYVLTAILLYFVWANSHWSVALAITLITLHGELVDVSMLKIAECFTALSEVLKIKDGGTQ